MKIKTYLNKEAVALDFSNYLAGLFSARKETHIALSGGSTPKIVFDVLADAFHDKIDWSTVHLYWGDERCVPPEDDQSNYKMTQAHLISKINIPKENIHRIRGENEPAAEAKRYAAVLKSRLPLVQGVPQFDIVILGLGDDGHTASIFPHELDLWSSDALCEVAEHPETGQKRISLTGQVINQGAVVTFLVTGENKQEKVREIIKKEGDYKQYPASLVAPISEELLWFIDEDAAYLLTSD